MSLEAFVVVGAVRVNSKSAVADRITVALVGLLF